MGERSDGVAKVLREVRTDARDDLIAMRSAMSDRRLVPSPGGAPPAGEGGDQGWGRPALEDRVHITAPAASPVHREPKKIKKPNPAGPTFGRPE
jgi:hypothetical protein